MTNIPTSEVLAGSEEAAVDSSHSFDREIAVDLFRDMGVKPLWVVLSHVESIVRLPSAVDPRILVTNGLMKNADYRRARRLLRHYREFVYTEGDRKHGDVDAEGMHIDEGNESQSDRSIFTPVPEITPGQSAIHALNESFGPFVIDVGNTAKDAVTQEQRKPAKKLSDMADGDDEPFELRFSEGEDYAQSVLTVAGGTTDMVRDYLRQAGRYKLLSAEDEVELSRSIEAGLLAQEQIDLHGDTMDPQLVSELSELARIGTEAKDRFILANLRLAVSVAKGYTGRGLALIDLIQEANGGLVHAAEMFDYQQGYKFSTYATFWIRQSLGRAIANHSRTIRLPVHMHDQVIKYRRELQQMRATLHREPTDQEIAAQMGVEAEKVRVMREAAGMQPFSLSTPVGESGEDAVFADLLEDGDYPDISEHVSSQIVHEEAMRRLQTLTQKEQQVIEMRFGLKTGKRMKLEEVGQMMGVTRERVRQIEAKALSRLRHPGRGLMHFADGHNEEEGWRAAALCAQTDPEAFFPDKGGSTREAKKVCASCEVKAECLDYALEKDERFGIWGGLSERERRYMRRAAARS